MPLNCLKKVTIFIMHENQISYSVRGAIFKVYRKLGPGLLESIYELALCYEIKKMGLDVSRQVDLPIHYENEILGHYRIDLLVENKVIIEIKSVIELLPVHHKQLLTYMKLSQIKLGLLVNFNVSDAENGIIRIVNGL